MYPSGVRAREYICIYVCMYVCAMGIENLDERMGQILRSGYEGGGGWYMRTTRQTQMPKPSGASDTTSIYIHTYRSQRSNIYSSTSPVHILTQLRVWCSNP